MRRELSSFSLDKVRGPRQVRIREVRGGRRATHLLAQLNIRAGGVLEVKRSAPWGGPVLVESNGTLVAVGRGLAQKVLVEVAG